MSFPPGFWSSIYIPVIWVPFSKYDVTVTVASDEGGEGYW